MSPPRVTRTDCGSEVVLRPGDIVICRECGYRILYKKRTKQSTSGIPDSSVLFSFRAPLARCECFRRDRFANRL